MYLPVIGRLLTVVVVEGKDKGTYQSSLLDIDSHHLFITRPQSPEGETIALSPGATVVLNYRDAKDIPCRFQTVIDKTPEGREGIHVLKCPELIERQQRREDVRIPIYSSVTLKGQSKTFEGSLNDLSGGGFSARIPAEHELDKGQIMCVEFEVSSGRQSIHVVGRAEAIGRNETEDQNLAGMYSFKFVDIPDKVSAELIEFVFERQLLDVTLKNLSSDLLF